MNYCLNQFCCSPLLIAALLLIPDLSFAQLDFNAGSRLEFIENPQREQSSEETDLLSATTVGASILRQTKFFDTAFNYTANMLEYSDDLLDDRSRLEGNGSVTWKALPDFLSWRVSNSRSNQLVDASQPDTPDNRQIIDFTTTGPSLLLPLRDSTFVNFGADFGTVVYEQSNLQNQNRNSYNLSIARIISQTITVSARSSYTATKFDDSFIPDYSFYSISGNVQLQNVDYEIAVEVGGYNTNRSGQKSSHPTLNFSGLYKVNSRLEITSEFSKSIDDLVSDVNNQGRIDQFFQDSDAALGQTFGNSNFSNLYKRKSVSFGANYTIESYLNLGIRYSQNQRDSIGNLGKEDDDRLSATLILPFPQFPRFTFNASAAFSERDFSLSKAIQDRADFTLGAIYQLTERLNLVLSVTESNQTSDLAIDNYISRNFSLGLSFTR